jgi:serine O-acetyltransferase
LKSFHNGVDFRARTPIPVFAANSGVVRLAEDLFYSGNAVIIDHGTGIVVGETAQIGDDVRLYQGVTLGALSMPKEAVERFRDKKRHPTIEDDVIIYSNTTILGGDTVIGARSTIGGNVWITESVPADTKVYLKKPELVYSANGRCSSSKKHKNKMTFRFKNKSKAAGGYN